MLMSSLRSSVAAAKPHLAMIFLQFGFAGMYVLAVASLKKGVSHYVLVVYRNAAGAAFMAPLALWFERDARPRMTLACLLKIMALALLEPVLDQNFYYVGAKLTSASFSTAMFNMIPAITFVIAVFLRIEKLQIKNAHSRAKIAGVVATVGGALLMILYKGPALRLLQTKGRRNIDTPMSAGGIIRDEKDFVKGTLMLVFCCFCWSGFYLLQSHTLESYRAEMTLTTWICLAGAVESGIVALVMERGRSTRPWAIGWDMRLAAAVYSGVMCSGIAYYVQGAVMRERGPVFVTAFSPLCMVIVAALGSFVLAEEITLGSVIGAVVVVAGLYLLLWAKSKDLPVKSMQRIEGDARVAPDSPPIPVADA